MISSNAVHRLTHHLRARLGVGSMVFGSLLLLFGGLAHSASAWQGSCYDYAPSTGAWAQFRVDMHDADIAQLSGGGQSFNDGALTVVMSGATKADSAAPLTVDNIGSLNFVADSPVDAVYAGAGVTADNIYLYSPAVTAANALTAVDTTSPLQWLTFCYTPAPESPSTTSAPTTTVAPTTTIAPTTTASETSTTAGPTVENGVVTTVPTQVLGVQLQRPQAELAFTGAHSLRLAMMGAFLLLAGAAWMLADRARVRRRTS